MFLWYFWQYSVCWSCLIKGNSGEHDCKVSSFCLQFILCERKWFEFAWLFSHCMDVDFSVTHVKGKGQNLTFQSLHGCWFSSQFSIRYIIVSATSAVPVMFFLQLSIAPICSNFNLLPSICHVCLLSNRNSRSHSEFNLGALEEWWWLQIMVEQEYLVVRLGWLETWFN